MAWFCDFIRFIHLLWFIAKFLRWKTLRISIAKWTRKIYTIISNRHECVLLRSNICSLNSVSTPNQLNSKSKACGHQKKRENELEIRIVSSITVNNPLSATLKRLSWENNHQVVLLRLKTVISLRRTIQKLGHLAYENSKSVDWFLVFKDLANLLS